MKDFNARVLVMRSQYAGYFASALFEECFNAPFPVPSENCGLTVATPSENWSQYIALYQWTDTHIETVGFCNFIRHGNVYLEGGMCVKTGFYRRLDKADFQLCKSRGGIAQMMMEAASVDLADCVAWFGHCGDAKALEVDKRVGFVTTHHRNLIVRWFSTIAPDQQIELIDSVAKIGAF